MHLTLSKAHETLRRVGLGAPKPAKIPPFFCEIFGSRRAFTPWACTCVNARSNVSSKTFFLQNNNSTFFEQNFFFKQDYLCEVHNYKTLKTRKALSLAGQGSETGESTHGFLCEQCDPRGGEFSPKAVSNSVSLYLHCLQMMFSKATAIRAFSTTGIRNYKVSVLGAAGGQAAFTNT